MTRREFITLLSGAAAMPPIVSRALALVWPMLGWTGGARAQTQARVPRIGYLTLAPLTDPPSPERAAFLHGLGELGYIDGKTITIEYQSGEMNVVMLPDAAAELVDRKVDLIVAAGTVACIAAKNATKSIPVVMMFSSEPVASGLVNSLARPGGNVTGLSTMQTELDAKRLEMLQEILPKISHVAVLWTTVHPSHQYSQCSAPPANGGNGVGRDEPKRLESRIRSDDRSATGRLVRLVGLSNPDIPERHRSICRHKSLANERSLD